MLYSGAAVVKSLIAQSLSGGGANLVVTARRRVSVGASSLVVCGGVRDMAATTAPIPNETVDRLERASWGMIAI